MSGYKPYPHQKETFEFYRRTPQAFDLSEMGTGKSYGAILDIEHRLYANPLSKTLILAPKSLLRTVWENEFIKFAPHIETTIAMAPEKKWIEAIHKEVPVYVTNIDAVKKVAKLDPSWFNQFETIIIDESETIKHPSSARTKAAMKIKRHFKYRRCLTGSPIGGPVTDIYAQTLFLDDGRTFNHASLSRFQNQTMYFVQNGPTPRMGKWHNKPGIIPAITRLLRPISIRHEINQVVDMPSQVEYPHTYVPNPKVASAYKQMQKSAFLQLTTGQITAINAAAIRTKLLQIAAGSVIDTATGEAHLVDTQRYDLVMDLVEQVDHSIVFFNWTAQRKHMMDVAQKRGLKCTYIDGTVSGNQRAERVKDYEKGKYRTVFIQIQAGAHGLTLIRATHTIFSSPSYLAPNVIQAKARNYRIGQHKRTVVVHVLAKGTADMLVYKNLNNKLSDIELLEEALADV